MPKQKQETNNDEAILLGREQQFEQIEAFLNSALDGSGESSSSPLSIYINGVPGTGKTATTKAVIERLQRQRKKFFYIFADCYEVSCSTVGGLSRKVLEQLEQKPGPVSRLSSQIEKAFLESRKPIVILLDEIDNLSPSLRYKVFTWPVSSNGRVILIGIANSLGLTERLLPKLKTILPPKVITFAPYSVAQLNTILHQKFLQEDVDQKAFDLCSRKVLAMTGDVRRAIDITKQMLDSVKDGNDLEADAENINPLPLKKAATPSPARICKPLNAASLYCTPIKSLKRPATDEGGRTTPKNACREVLRLVKKVSDSPLKRSQLPLHPRILLATFMRLLTKPMQSATAKRSVQRLTSTKAMLYTAYYKVCEQLSFQPLSDDELESVYNILESQSMISLKPKGGVVVFEVEFELAKQVINDDALLNSIDAVSLP